jgi:hypothetical protein
MSGGRENYQKNDIEGLDNDDYNALLGEYPIDTVLIRNENRTVHDVLRRIEKGDYIMNPDFSRDFIWPEEMQSKLIESVLMRIPLPAFYLAENPEGKMIVVDGLQRLSTFQSFVTNKLKLKLPHQKELHQKTFSELSYKLQNRVEDSNLIIYAIDAKAPSRALLDIFDRVNSGIPLTIQQLRNCFFMGPATKFLKTEAETDLFKKATGYSLDTAKMRERELINRFCAFFLFGAEKYEGRMDDFLNRALEKMNKLKAIELENLSSKFRTSMKNNLTVFGEHAFRKHFPDKEGRSAINASLWDVLSTGLSHYPEQLVQTKAEKLKAEIYRLFSDEEFIDAITLGTNQANRVRERFQKIESVLKEVLGDYSD